MTIKAKCGIAAWMASFGLVAFLFLLLVLGFPFAQVFEAVFNENEIHARDAYAGNWNLYINQESDELFYAESEDRAFGEGLRVSVLSGRGGYYEAGERMSLAYTSNDITKKQGYGEDAQVQSVLDTICESLDVPQEYAPTLSDNHWIQLTQPDGHSASTLVMISVPNLNNTDNTIYIAEDIR